MHLPQHFLHKAKINKPIKTASNGNKIKSKYSVIEANPIAASVIANMGVKQHNATITAPKPEKMSNLFFILAPLIKKLQKSLA